MVNLLTDTNSIYSNGIKATAEEVQQALDEEITTLCRPEVISKLHVLSQLKGLALPLNKPGTIRNYAQAKIRQKGYDNTARQTAAAAI
ncbi:MAG: hypothetical protein HWE07_13360 [Cytophagia bacterium]|nr:hypothetical protein [Cytophagia bacterium]